MNPLFLFLLPVPPYGIHNGINNGPGPLDMKTVSMDTDSKLGKQYDIHNIFGWAEELRTWNALQAIDSKKRPFLISRSTYPSSGKYTHHWLGDNYSTFLYMAKAIQGMLQFNIFGIPMVGPVSAQGLVFIRAGSLTDRRFRSGTFRTSAASTVTRTKNCATAGK